MAISPASSSSGGAFWRPIAGGVRVAVKVQPKSRRPGVGGLAPDGARLRVAVAEPPEDGRANRAVCDALARALGVRGADIVLAAGAASRDKTLIVTGDATLLAARLEAL